MKPLKTEMVTYSFHILGCSISFMQHNTSLTTTLFFVITGKLDNEAPVVEQTNKGDEGNEVLTPKTPVTHCRCFRLATYQGEGSR
jgi:hypothetical protein